MILMYHHISPRAEVPAAPPPEEGWLFTLSPEGFENQLQELLNRGYRFGSLDDAVREIRRTGREPSRSVQITLDDGWIDQYRYALPVLRRLGLTATFFVTTQHLRDGVEDPRKMSRDQLLDLIDSGMTIGGHSRTHSDLTTLSKHAVLDEVAGCRADLEKALGSAVTLFAYPGGAFNATVAQIVRDSGFAAACSVLGPAPNASSSLYWLYRDTLTEGMRTRGDLYRLSQVARRLLAFRVKRRLRAQLSAKEGRVGIGSPVR